MWTSAGGPSRPGLLVCRHPKPVGISLTDGLRLTTPAETILAAARDLGVLDLVVMADSALRLEHCTVTDLVDRLLNRSWDPRRLAAWNQLVELVEHSLYGRTGRARAYRHWRRATT